MWPPNESREKQGNFGCFIRRPPTADQTAELDLTRTGDQRRFHSAVSEPPNWPERLKSIRYERRFHLVVVAADPNRRIIPEASSLIRRFHSAARSPIQTAVSPILVKPREKPRAFSNSDLRAKTSTQGECADVSEQQRKTNYMTHRHTTTYNKEVQVWKVTCEENAHNASILSEYVL